MKQQLTTQQLARKLARDLRTNLTEAEKRLWQKLRNKQLMGYKFLSQHPLFYIWNNKVKFFISDFYCHALRLVIEVDGGIHELQEEYDRARTELLSVKNIKVIRFKNSDVINNINKVLIQIKNQVRASIPKRPPDNSRGAWWE
jgi:very-short-patch-repair endonuclease